MGFVNKVSGTCWKCTEKEHGPDYRTKGVRESRIFYVTRAIVTRRIPGGTGIVDVRDAICCEKCGELVPLDSWRQYQSKGDIVIRKSRERKETDNGHADFFFR